LFRLKVLNSSLRTKYLHTARMIILQIATSRRRPTRTNYRSKRRQGAWICERTRWNWKVKRKFKTVLHKVTIFDSLLLSN